jgi:hypothetical protein
MLKNIINNIKKKIFFRSQWYIIYKKNKKWIFLDQPNNISRADPFIVSYNEKIFIFFEEFNIYKRHGHICVGEFSEKNRSLLNIKVILKKKYHLSFPFVFKEKNIYYMIPESHQKKSIDLYKFVKFPYKLKFVKCLIKNIDAVDTIIYKKKYWYLFTNIKDKTTNDYSNNLSLFYSKNFLNKLFKPHVKNPISTSSSSTRNAGRILYIKKKLIRVSQDCKRIYGKNINFMQIKTLNIKAYKEIFVKKIAPPTINKNKLIAFHTYNKFKNIYIADGKISLIDLRNFFINIYEILKKKLYIFF